MAKRYTFLTFLRSIFTIQFYRPSHLARFFDEKGKSKEEFYFDVFLMILILISSGLFILETYPLDTLWNTLIRSLDVIIMIFFTIELFARLRVANFSSDYFKSFYNITDVIAVVPFWLSFIFPIVGSLQFLRVFRLFKIFRYFDKYFSYKRVPRNKITKILIMKVAFSMFVLLYVSSGLFYTFEHQQNNDINSFDDAVYFSLVTVTTVGFGDITPVTKSGQVIVMLIILAGVFSIPVYMSTLLQEHFGRANKKRLVCARCGLEYHEESASHCRNCGLMLGTQST